MVRSPQGVSNHEATNGPSSFETRARRAPQDEGRNAASFSSWAGLVPAIHVFGAGGKQVVDARDKPGHDDGGWGSTLDEPPPTAYLFPCAVARSLFLDTNSAPGDGGAVAGAFPEMVRRARLG